MISRKALPGAEKLEVSGLVLTRLNDILGAIFMPSRFSAKEGDDKFFDRAYVPIKQTTIRRMYFFILQK